VIPLLFAHRGASGRYPENTLDAFQAALRHKADGIELDVQLTLDGEVVVIHDHRLERTTDGNGLVQQYTLAELRQFSAGEWLHPRFRMARIPSFREVCQLVQSSPVKMIVEMKNFFIPQPHLEEKVVELIHQYDLSERTVVSSFNFNSLVRIKELDKRLQTALLYVGSLREPWEIARKYGADQVHAPSEEVTATMVKETRRRGLAIYAWTVNSRKRMKALAAIKVSGLITNYPLRARKLFYPNPLR
jgi:glycerophosphoryl diester phosphodiesterase